MAKNSGDSGVWVIVIAIMVVAFPAIFFVINSSSKETAKNKCNSNEVYVESTNTCRTKTVSERFDDQCKGTITVGGTSYTCGDIKNANLEEAYINKKTIVKHGNSIYELGAYSEIEAGKAAGDYCLSAADTWSHIGETRCVVFYPKYLAHSGNNYFIDEKKDYKNGFVVYMYGNYGWNWFWNTYGNGTVLVCGTITTYQGHPQIKATPSSTMTNPQMSADHILPVYKYSCK